LPRRARQQRGLGDHRRLIRRVWRHVVGLRDLDIPRLELHDERVHEFGRSEDDDARSRIGHGRSRKRQERHQHEKELFQRRLFL
jgi:hypothetical protein